MKKFILLVIGLAVELAAHSQVSFSINETRLTPGETKKVAICMNCNADVISYQFDIELPENVTIATTGKGQRPAISDWTETHTVASAMQSDGSCRFIVKSDENEIYDHGTGEIMTVTMIADNDAELGSYSLKIKNITVTLDGLVKLPVVDATWNCKVYDTYTRTVTQGNVGTICLPWDVELSEVEGAEFYSLAGKVMSGGKASSIVAETVEDKLVAGRPYIFKATAGTITANYYSAAVGVAGSYNGLIGTFSENSNIAGKYMIANNSVRKCATGSTCKANRAYIDMASVPVYGAPSGSARRLVSIGLDDSETTGIDGVEACSEDTEVYSVSGVRKSSESNGINIVKSKSGVKKILK